MELSTLSDFTLMELGTLNDFTKKLHMEVVGTQNDLLKFKDEIVHQLLKVQLKTDNVEKNMMTQDDKRELISHIDAFAQKIEVYDRKVIVQDERLNNHEARITRLETSRP